MGGFYSQTKRPQMSAENVRNIRGLLPVQGEPAAENPGLSNTVGTVALALSGKADGSGTNQDSGSNSFFINLTSNTFLDPDFTVFAAIPDMTVANQIMALSTLDRTQDPEFGADSGNLAFSKVPVQANGFQVFIKRAFLITDAMTIAKDTAGVQSVMSQSAQNFASAPDSIVSSPGAALSTSTSSSSPGLLSNNVPEPASFAMGLSGLISFAFFTFRRRRS